jgi:hypothetical protein
VLDLNYERCFSFHQQNCIPIGKDIDEEQLMGIVGKMQ